jgi:hypothetical protein
MVSWLAEKSVIPGKRREAVRRPGTHWSDRRAQPGPSFGIMKPFMRTWNPAALLNRFRVGASLRGACPE